MKHTATFLASTFILAIVTLVIATLANATTLYGTDAAPADSQATVAENAESKLLGPHWSVGDEWIVETETLSAQYSKENEKELVWSKPVRWKFRVEAVEYDNEIFDDAELLKASIVCLEENQSNPKLSIWIDSDSGALVRLESTSTVAGEEITFEETYVGYEGTVAVMGTIPVIPLDMPLFNIAKSDDNVTKYAYTIYQGKPTKAASEIYFARRVKQSAIPVENDPSGESVEIILESGSDRVMQIWEPGKPWASCGSNGPTRFRLIEDDSE